MSGYGSDSSHAESWLEDLEHRDPSQAISAARGGCPSTVNNPTADAYEEFATAALAARAKERSGAALGEEWGGGVSPVGVTDGTAGGAVVANADGIEDLGRSARFGEATAGGYADAATTVSEEGSMTYGMLGYPYGDEVAAREGEGIGPTIRGGDLEDSWRNELETGNLCQVLSAIRGGAPSTSFRTKKPAQSDSLPGLEAVSAGCARKDRDWADENSDSTSGSSCNNFKEPAISADDYLYPSDSSSAGRVEDEPPRYHEESYFSDDSSISSEDDSKSLWKSRRRGSTRFSAGDYYFYSDQESDEEHEVAVRDKGQMAAGEKKARQSSSAGTMITDFFLKSSGDKGAEAKSKYMLREAGCNLRSAEACASTCNDDNESNESSHPSAEEIGYNPYSAAVDNNSHQSKRSADMERRLQPSPPVSVPNVVEFSSTDESFSKSGASSHQSSRSPGPGRRLSPPPPTIIPSIIECYTTDGSVGMTHASNHQSSRSPGPGGRILTQPPHQIECADLQDSCDGISCGSDASSRSPGPGRRLASDGMPVENYSAANREECTISEAALDTTEDAAKSPHVDVGCDVDSSKHSSNQIVALVEDILKVWAPEGDSVNECMGPSIISDELAGKAMAPHENLIKLVSPGSMLDLLNSSEEEKSTTLSLSSGSAGKKRTVGSSCGLYQLIPPPPLNVEPPPLTPSPPHTRIGRKFAYTGYGDECSDSTTPDTPSTQQMSTVSIDHIDWLLRSGSGLGSVTNDESCAASGEVRNDRFAPDSPSEKAPMESSGNPLMLGVMAGTPTASIEPDELALPEMSCLPESSTKSDSPNQCIGQIFSKFGVEKNVPDSKFIMGNDTSESEEYHLISDAQGTNMTARGAAEECSGPPPIISRPKPPRDTKGSDKQSRRAKGKLKAVYQKLASSTKGSVSASYKKFNGRIPKNLLA